MKSLLAMLLAGGAIAAAQAQAPSPAPATMDALRRNFPADHGTLAASLAGKSIRETAPLVHAGMQRFLQSHRESIVAAPPATILALEARQAALLRAVERKDVQVCARVGDRGLFSTEMLPALPVAGLDEYGAALIEAARPAAGKTAAPDPNAEDLTAWIAAIEKIQPDVPVQKMLLDREFRAAATPAQLCRGAAAMHEAVAKLPQPQAERVARMLLKSSVAPDGP
ncbi:hypothetical protein E2493_08070 [Sphingomonas parva]|uniref:Uncharacterized protein n=1 Tax=Sphingomonas parva TaxID=2555898 RepID=A0A4Y8ZTJ1_9SPHN|nr:hypothetical protein [Sphingomonas parva]TFI58807.1 hypothetical protein E2493_08070 [Sphingomonas parva]